MVEDYKQQQVQVEREKQMILHIQSLKRQLRKATDPIDVGIQTDCTGVVGIDKGIQTQPIIQKTATQTPRRHWGMKSVGKY